jgi:oxygen-dependent protoporphyrinogen oxidase
MKILILGGGITGLSAAWHALKKYPNAHITLLEKEGRLGGWIRTKREGGFLFEQGPRTFQHNRSPHLLKLLSELNLPIITSSPQKRYICHQGRLRSLSSFIPMLLPYLVRELFLAPKKGGDESIYDFASRRFSPKIAELFFDPLTLGIYGGDIRKLSIRSCFPFLPKMEEEKGSIVRGMFSAPRGGASGLFTLKNGMETLIETLEKRLEVDFVLNCPVESIGETAVEAGGSTWHADKIINALPLPFPAQSLYVVNVVFEGDVLLKKGYGYLIPTQEKSSLLGCIFDSSIFPEQSIRGETRLTAMVRPEEKEPLEAVLSAFAAHLGIRAKPIYSSTFLAKNAIPQFEVGCGFRGGVSVDACIARSEAFCVCS